MTIPPNPRMLPALRLLALLLLGPGLLALGACGDDDGLAPGEPATLTLADSGFTFTAVGQNHLFVATVKDRRGDAVNTRLSWSTSDPSVLKLNGDGLATAAASGDAVVTVSIGGLSASATVAVRQVPAHIATLLGDGQGGEPSQPLPVPLTVQVTDALNHPVPGVAVVFTTPDTDATVAPDTVVTDFFGTAGASFTLGADTGDYSASATVVGTTLTTHFDLRTSGPFSIELIYVSNPPSAGQAQAFALARQRWEGIITADLPDDYASLPPNSCGASPALDRPIDDLIIFVSIENIDGPGGILGQAAPCFFHNVGLLPAIGQMTFDAADLDVIEQAGLLTPVVLHEMGHVLGYGTIWSDLGLLADPAGLGGLDPHFTGPLAIAAFDSTGGAGYALGKVPVEDQGGPGTADGHWRETVFDNEIMTGYVNLGANPLSVVSIASLADLGYAVDYSRADPYVIAAPFRSTARAGRLHLQDDIPRGPFRRTTLDGRSVGGYRR